MTKRERETYTLACFPFVVLNLSERAGWFITQEHEGGRVDIENIYSGERVGNLPRERLTRGWNMRYTLTLNLGELPGWVFETVTAVLDEHDVAWTHWGKGLLDVSGDNELATRLACDAALSRVGRNYRALVIDLFA
jgi:hypothetical protein